MMSRITLLETANNQANGHIEELSNELSVKYEENKKLKANVARFLTERDEWALSKLEIRAALTEIAETDITGDQAASVAWKMRGIAENVLKPKAKKV